MTFLSFRQIFYSPTPRIRMEADAVVCRIDNHPRAD